MKIRMLVALLACLVSVTAVAQTAAPAASAASEPLQIVLQQQTELKARLDHAQTEGLSARQVSAIRKAQNEVFAITEGKATLDALSMDQKIRLDNALERINAEVKNTRVGMQEQDTCWREPKTGSAVKVTRCGTKAERDEAREGAKAWLEKPKICIPPGCGAG